ncbi:MAG: protein kinase domain-containing protein, partial [Vicinamibacterales bacterium]
MPLPPGVSLGPYVIRSLLGSGGMGEVYVARDSKLNRDVALKLLPADLADDAGRLRRFEQEARAASALNHPAIVAIYDLGQVESQPFISMELVEGQTLRQMLETGSMRAQRALQLAAPIADGLAKAHEAGIVHRDLKPENLMISRDGFAKILDFGLAKLVGQAHAGTTIETMTEHGTRPGSVVGTVGYMAPEQASGGAADYRSDQFSFGLVLYEMLTGQRAFRRSTSVETLAAIIREDPTPIEQLNPSIPAPVRWIVDRCLAKNPADRYASTRDLSRDLSSARDHFSELTSSSAAGVPAARPTVRVGWRELVAWTLVAAVGVAALALLLRPTQNATAEPDRTVRFTISAPKDVNFTSSVGSSPFAVSPDGRHLLFSGIGGPDTRRRLWLQPFDSLDARPIPKTEGAFAPFWSPDSSSVGFFTATALKRVAISGGDVVTICEARFGGGATWNREGVILFAPSLDAALLQVSAAGGTATPVTVLDTANDESAHVGPVFLPDGRHYLFGMIGGKAAGNYVAALDSPERKQLPIEGRDIASMVGFMAPDLLFFMRGRTLMARRLDLERLELVGEPIRAAEDVDVMGAGASFAVSASGTLVYWAGDRTITQPTWFQRDGTSVGTLGPPAGYMNVAISPNGREAAVDRFDTTTGIWLLDPARGTMTRSTAGELYESTPVWSPDGGQLVFAAARDTPPNLYLKKVGAPPAEEERLFRSLLQSFPQSWSPDGRLIAYVTIDPKTNSADVWIVPVSGDRKPYPFLQTKFAEGHPRISPDGRWMAYASTESGPMGVYVTRFPEPGGKWAVSTNGGDFPIWRRDGRELYYRAPDGTLMAVPIASGPNFAPGKPIPLFKPQAALGTLGLGTFYDVAPDGRFLINIFVERT